MTPYPHYHSAVCLGWRQPFRASKKPQSSAHLCPIRRTRSCTSWTACWARSCPSLARPGLQAGQFTFLHSVALDSKGNLYTGETINGRRVQKFTHIECNNGNGQGNGNGNCS